MATPPRTITVPIAFELNEESKFVLRALGWLDPAAAAAEYQRGWDNRAKAATALDAVQRPIWASTPPGFAHTNPLLLARALEAVRRRTCAYGAHGALTCDCKYGLDENTFRSSEQTGCPELRCVIEALLALAGDTTPSAAAGESETKQ